MSAETTDKGLKILAEEIARLDREIVRLRGVQEGLLMAIKIAEEVPDDAEKSD